METVLSINDTTEPAILITSPIQQRKPSFVDSIRDRISTRRSTMIPPILRTSSAGNVRFLNNLIPRSMTNRQRAEIQLDSILNDPEVSLPAFIQRAGGHTLSDNLSIEEVSKLLKTPIFIVQRLVNLIYSANNGEATKSITKFQITKLTRVLNGTMDVRALLFFMMLDENEQYVTDRGLREFYEQYLKALTTLEDSRMEEVILVLLKKFHLDQKPRIDFEEFFAVVSQDSTLLESLSKFSVHPEWFIKTSPTAIKQNRLQCFFSKLYRQQFIYEKQGNQSTIDYIKNNLSRVIFFLLYLLINIALTIYVIIYRVTVTKSNVFVVFARIGGMLLNFNCSFTIVLMLRRTILLIRTNSCLRKLIPVDDHIDFHRVVGRVIAALSVLHTVAHMANFGTLKQYSWAEYMFTTKPNIGWVGGFASLSGVILCVLLTIMIICSMEWVRRGGHFQIFYWTHLLYFPFFVFLIFHATNFWKWIIGPLTLLLLEKLYSMLTRFSTRSGRTYLHSATIEQSNVIRLNIHRPKNLTFKPGDYIAINLPRVALFEFHPFTISSAPEELNFLTVHIQAVGNWTKQVYQHYKDISEGKIHDTDIKVYRADINAKDAFIGLKSNGELTENEREDEDVDVPDNEHVPSGQQAKPVKREPIIINGPYSSCARYVFDCKHAVLIGGGIGITPYASILSSLMAQFNASRVVCRKCQTINYNTKGLLENYRLKKVDFIWVNRDQKSFEWFLNLLGQFEEEQEHYLKSNSNEKRFLDIHLYFTDLKFDESIGNAPLDFITKIWSQMADNDIYTSLKSKTHLGRPKWDELFRRLTSTNTTMEPNDVSVFFCGPPTMATVIQDHCQKYRFRFYEEKF